MQTLIILHETPSVIQGQMQTKFESKNGGKKKKRNHIYTYYKAREASAMKEKGLKYKGKAHPGFKGKDFGGKGKDRRK